MLFPPSIRERWSCLNHNDFLTYKTYSCMKFNKGKCEVLHLGQIKLKEQYNTLGSAWLGCRLAEKDLGDHPSGRRVEHELAACLGSSEGKLGPGLHQQEYTQQTQGCDYSTLLGTHQATPGILCREYCVLPSSTQILTNWRELCRRLPR